MRQVYPLLFIIFFMLTGICLADSVVREKQFFDEEGYLVPTIKSQDPLLTSYSQALASQPTRQANYTITVIPLATQFPNIILYATVLDTSGNFVTGLTQDQFMVSEQSSQEASATEQTLTCFYETTAGESGISFALVFDLSESMTGSKLADAKTAANNFLANSSANDRGALVSFSSGGTQRIVYPANWVTTDLDANGTYDISDAINGLEASGLTAVYDGTSMGIDSLSQEPSPKAVIVFSDGRTNDDQSHNINSVIAKANNEGVLIFTIGLGIRSQKLQDMAEATGGAFYFAPTALDMTEIYNTIAKRIRNHYTLCYTTHNPDLDGTTRTVTVTRGPDSGTGFYVVNDKPEIFRDEPTQMLSTQYQPPAVGLTISGTITDEDAHQTGQNLTGVIYYRTIGETQYTQANLNLQLTDPDNGIYTFSYPIDADDVAEPGLEYYLFASDQIQETYSPFNYNILPWVIPVGDQPPVISHTPVDSAPANQPVHISADVTDADPADQIQQVILYYRPDNPDQTTPFFTTVLTHTGGNTWEGEIPATQVSVPAVDYFISAWDSRNLRADHGTAESPHVIQVFINQPPIADAGTDLSVEEGQTVRLDGAASTDPDGDPLTYQWVQLNGGTVTLTQADSANPEFTAPQTGPEGQDLTFQLTVTDPSNAQTIDTVQVTVTDATPTASFTWNPMEPEVGTPVQFTDQSTSQDPITSWNWQFGNEGTDTAQSPTFTFNTPGAHVIQLTVTDGDGSTHVATHTIQVAEAGTTDTTPDADFTWNPDEPVIGAPIQFTDTSTSVDPIVAWNWEFGNEGTDTVQSPTFTFSTPGPHLIRLTVTDSDGSTNVQTYTLTLQQPQSNCPDGDCDAGSGCFIGSITNTHPEAFHKKSWGIGLIMALIAGLVVLFTLAGKANGILRRLLILCLLIGFLILPSKTWAQVKPGAVTLSPMVGGYWFDSKQDIERGPIYGFGVGYNFTENITAKLAGHYGQFDHLYWDCQSCECLEEDVDATLIQLDVKYHFGPENRFVPFVAIGGGYMDLNFDNTADESSSLVNYGAGFKYFFNESIALLADLRHVYLLDDDDSNFMANIGLEIQLGGKPRKPQSSQRYTARPTESQQEPISKKMDQPEKVKQQPMAQKAVQQPTPQKLDQPESPEAVTSSRKRTEPVSPTQPSGVPVTKAEPVAEPTVKKMTPSPKPAPQTQPLAEQAAVKPEEVIQIRIQFDFDRAYVKPKYHSTIKKAADWLKAHPGTEAIIEGHTCSLGTDAYNQRLAKRRAESVKSYMVRHFFISSSRLITRSYGESRPDRDNRTEQGRRLNRRVIIRLTE